MAGQTPRRSATGWPEALAKQLQSSSVVELAFLRNVEKK